MASIAIDDIEPELLEKLALRAKRLGTTVESEALRALREHVTEQEQSEAAPLAVKPMSQAPANAPEPPQTLPADPRFVRKHGIWVFTGKLDPRLIPDHRDLREERIDSFVKAALGESSD